MSRIDPSNTQLAFVKMQPVIVASSRTRLAEPLRRAAAATLKDGPVVTHSHAGQRCRDLIVRSGRKVLAMAGVSSFFTGPVEDVASAEGAAVMGTLAERWPWNASPSKPA